MSTVNKVREVVYVAVGFTTGLTDLTLAVRKPNGTLVTPAPTFTEQGAGVYTASYTPDAVGTWQERVGSVTNGDNVVRGYDVVAFDADDVKAQTDSIETKVDTVDGKVDVVDGKVDTIDGKVDVVDGKIDTLDGKADNIQTTINTVESKVDALDNAPGGYFA